jgi:hypothetical protein
MADTTQGSASAQEPLDKGKGKGKATEPAAGEVNMETEEDSTSEEELEDVRTIHD